jgi:pimeloyl-ACP methyl ester carboxylesterase
MVGRGDSHPVLVLPGFVATDRSTVALRSLIRGWGFWAHGWGLGTNMGPTPEIIAGLRSRLDSLYERHGGKVSVVGWSLGGIFARELARQSPDKVRQVITLGSPIQLQKDDRSNASGIADLLEPTFDPTYMRTPDYERGPLPVPSTSIFTRSDGIVRWQLCLDVVDEMHDNVEVKASHVGLGYNPSALYVVADRLNRREGQWKPFRAPIGLGSCFPKAESFEPERHHVTRPRRATGSRSARPVRLVASR